MHAGSPGHQGNSRLGDSSAGECVAPLEHYGPPCFFFVFLKISETCLPVIQSCNEVLSLSGQLCSLSQSGS